MLTFKTILGKKNLQFDNEGIMHVVEEVSLLKNSVSRVYFRAILKPLRRALVRGSCLE